MPIYIKDGEVYIYIYEEKYRNNDKSFIVSINQFKPRKEITFIKERSRAIIFNTIQNTLDKRTRFKDVINIFSTMITHIARVCNF